MSSPTRPRVSLEWRNIRFVASDPAGAKVAAKKAKAAAKAEKASPSSSSSPPPPPTKSAKKVKKTILHNVSGSVQPGELCAIMGPSGSGKSSLLNILNGDTRRGVTGEVLVGGRPLSEHLRAKSGGKSLQLWGYVTQQCEFYSMLTLKETLHFTAALKMPRGSTPSEISARTAEVMSQLDLVAAADTYVSKLSGGEQRRLCMAAELLNDPPLLYLDEPTSGLDATSALRIVKILATLAHEHGRTIVCCIHQPRQSILSLFDSLLLLAKGRVIYQGPAQSAELLRYFSAQLHCECPPHENPADFIVDLVNEQRDDVRALLGIDEKVFEKLYREDTESTSALRDGDGGPKLLAGSGEDSTIVRSRGDGNNDTNEEHAATLELVELSEPTLASPEVSIRIADADADAAAAADKLKRQGNAGAGAGAGVGTDTGADATALAVEREKSDEDDRVLRAEIFSRKFAAYRARVGDEEMMRASRRALTLPPTNATGGGGGGGGGDDDSSTARTTMQRVSWLKQFDVVFRRTFLQKMRDPLAFASQATMGIVLALLLGSIYWQVDTSQSAINDRLAAISFSVMTFCFLNFDAVLLFPQERAIFNREKRRGMYTSSSWYLSRSLVEVPGMTLIAVIAATIIYFMMGFPLNASAILRYYFGTWLIVLVGASAMLMIGCLSATFEQANIMATLIFLFFSLFNGYFVNQENIPVYYDWIQYVSFMKYGVEMAAVVAFQGVTFTCADDERVLALPNGTHLDASLLTGDNTTAALAALGIDNTTTPSELLRCPIETGDEALESLGFGPGPYDRLYWIGAVVLAAMIVGFRVIGYFGVVFMHNGRTWREQTPEALWSCVDRVRGKKSADDAAEQ